MLAKILQGGCKGLIEGHREVSRSLGLGSLIEWYQSQVRQVWNEEMASAVCIQKANRLGQIIDRIGDNRLGYTG